MSRTTLDAPSLRRPAAVNAAQYWLTPDHFARRCEGLGDRFQVAMPATGPWLCLTRARSDWAQQRRWRRACAQAPPCKTITSHVISQLGAGSTQRPAPRNGFDSRQLHRRRAAEMRPFTLWRAPMSCSAPLAILAILGR